MTLEKLYSMIANRLKNDNSNSYVCALAKRGKNRIIQKVGEEAIEVVIAMQDQNRKKQISEKIDLILSDAHLKQELGIQAHQSILFKFN